EVSSDVGLTKATSPNFITQISANDRRREPRRPIGEISRRTSTTAKEIKITTNRHSDDESRAGGPGRPLHLWVVFIITYWKEMLISSDELGPGDIHRFLERAVMTRRGDETVVDRQDDDAVADEATHDLLGHICITPLQSYTGVRVKLVAYSGMSELDGL